MKKQYFGDRRDLFKYDLLLDLVEAHGHHRLTIIPMLTPDDGTSEGNLRQQDRRLRRESLFEFLRACLAEERRDLENLRPFFADFGIDLSLVWPGRHLGAGAADREAYFAGVSPEALSRSVVFFDPDIGLEPRTTSYMMRNGPEKYLLYEELRALWDRATGTSVFVVYQHLQRNAAKRPSDLAHRLLEVSRHLRVKAVAVAQGDLAFVVAAKSASLESGILATLERHAQIHDLEFVDGPVEEAPTQGGPTAIRPMSAQGKRSKRAAPQRLGGPAVPAISRFFGIRILMFHKDHPRPHFHARYAGHEATISIETLEVLTGRLPRRAMALVLEWSMLHRPELRENWGRAERHEPLLEIPGLDQEA